MWPAALPSASSHRPAFAPAWALSCVDAVTAMKGENTRQPSTRFLDEAPGRQVRQVRQELQHTVSSLSWRLWPLASHTPGARTRRSAADTRHI
eukprot:6515848-Prymnesium_polylepis.2